MSGPKVVNIEAIRRQQRRACEAQLGVLRQCIYEHSQHQKVGNGYAEMMNRIEALRRGEQYTQLLQEVNAYVDFYRAENIQLHGKAVTARVEAHRKAHLVGKAAAQMRELLQGLSATSERSKLLEQLADNNDLESLGNAIVKAEAELANSQIDRQKKEMADQIRTAAAGFLDPNHQHSAPLRPGVERDPHQVRLERCWHLISELELEGDDAVQTWQAKLNQAANADSTEQGLLVDSIALELGELLKQSRLRRELVLEAQRMLQGLEVLLGSPVVQEWRVKLTALVEAKSLQQADRGMLKECQLWIDNEHQQADARAQRIAVLNALSELGYEVREGMATAWTQNGRVVVKKPSEKVYGVELSAPSVGQAFQVRVVASGSEGRSKQRDVEVESEWCADFKQLRSSLEKSGYATAIKHAKAPGEVAIKSIEEESTASTQTHRDTIVTKREKRL